MNKSIMMFVMVVLMLFHPFDVALATAAAAAMGRDGRQLNLGSHIQSRIINGMDAPELQWPFMVSIQYYADFLSSGQHFCGGSILNDDTILTAAHCLLIDGVEASSTWIYTGHVSLESKNNSFFFQAKEFIPHESFSMDNLANGHDVGVIKLETPIHFEHFDPKQVAKVCLPDVQEQAVMEQCVVMGWGVTSNGTITDRLQQVTVPMLSEDQCHQSIPGFNQETLFCAGYQEGGKDSCQGDSGGPLLCPLASQPNEWVQFGVVSFGDGCAKGPGFYTKVQALDQWIVEHAMATDTATTEAS